MNPRTPPPVGPCQLADWVFMTGAASANMASDSCRRAARASWNMMAVLRTTVLKEVIAGCDEDELDR